MKTLGLCSLLFFSILIPCASGQDLNIKLPTQSKLPLNSSNDEWMQQLLQRYPGSKVIGMYRSPVKTWTGALEGGCGTMQTYRVKREAPDSDVTRPSGYTPCVPLSRFHLESAFAPEEPEPTE